MQGLIGPLYGFELFTPSQCLDPSHPLLHRLDPDRPFNAVTRRAFYLPRYQDPDGAFAVRVLPNGLLNRRESVTEDPFNNPVLCDEVAAMEGRDVVADDTRRPISIARLENPREKASVSWVTISGKASVHKSAYVRSTISYRLKEAANLIVARGAAVTPVGSSKGTKQHRLVWREEDVGGDKWFRQGMPATTLTSGCD